MSFQTLGALLTFGIRSATLRAQTGFTGLIVDFRTTLTSSQFADEEVKTRIREGLCTAPGQGWDFLDNLPRRFAAVPLQQDDTRLRLHSPQLPKLLCRRFRGTGRTRPSTVSLLHTPTLSQLTVDITIPYIEILCPPGVGLGKPRFCFKLHIHGKLGSTTASGLSSGRDIPQRLNLALGRISERTAHLYGLLDEHEGYDRFCEAVVLTIANNAVLFEPVSLESVHVKLLNLDGLKGVASQRVKLATNGQFELVGESSKEAGIPRDQDRLHDSDEDASVEAEESEEEEARDSDAELDPRDARTSTPPEVPPAEAASCAKDSIPGKSELSYQSSLEDMWYKDSVFVALGSNVGDRLEAIEAACSAIDSDPDMRILRTSSLYETEPMYVEDQARFLNGVCEVSVIPLRLDVQNDIDKLKVETALEPIELLDRLQALEKDLGRIKTIDKGPRSIDLDILLYKGRKVESERLTIPHALMKEREFVLRPLAE
jgi:2-amino-4-hydroxy-6-hydroxymethyldihydropteridine diphosphokinase